MYVNVVVHNSPNETDTNVFVPFRLKRGKNDIFKREYNKIYENLMELNTFELPN